MLDNTSNPTSVHPVGLTIAGSDSGGGAGIQADLKAFHYFGVHGISALTAATAQNPHEVSGIYPLSAEAVAAQLDALFAAFSVCTAKTGMLFSREIIDAVADSLDQRPPLKLVVDPVMVATSGARLLKEDAVESLRRRLLPLAAVITPNIPEAEILSGTQLQSLEDAAAAAADLSRQFEACILIKGGHRSAESATDILVDGKNVWRICSPILSLKTAHGTGCMLSSAIAANLAIGHDTATAVKRAKAYVYGSLKNCVRVGSDTYALMPPAALPLDDVTIEAYKSNT